MTPDELRDRILRWEDPHTDFKESIDSNGELAKDLVCFANSDGGQLVIGVAKDRSVVGVPDTDQLLLRVDDVAFQNCSPSLTVLPEVIKLDGKDVVVLNIPKGDQRPYSTREGRYYIRSGARCRRASREELLRLFQAAHSRFCDEQPLPRLALVDLDLDAVTRYLVDTNQVDLDDDLVRLLRAWRMYDGSFPTVGGLVLFGRNPQAELESSRVVVGALASDDIGCTLPAIHISTAESWRPNSPPAPVLEYDESLDCSVRRMALGRVLWIFWVGCGRSFRCTIVMT